MRSTRLLASGLALLLLLPGISTAQRTQLRGSQAHFGAAIGIFTYHGRVDLNVERSSTNFTRSSDPAAILIGSFPIIRDKLFFRGMAGLTNLSSLRTKGALTNNEFLNRELFWFEPQVVYTIFRGSTHQFLPYVYTGFGGLLADPFGGPSGDVDQPGGGVPGPERSVFTLPLGVGVDYPVSHRFSFFADVSYRINFNYVGRNEGAINPHNTSLVMFGMRFRMGKIERVVEQIPPVELPNPITIPPYAPPVATTKPSPDQCVLAAMNTIYFDTNSTEITEESRILLDENVEALQLNPACCAQIVGYTEGGDTEEAALKISRERATFVFDYYTQNSIESDRLAIRERGMALPCLLKEDPECSVNKRVESEMQACTAFPGYRGQ